MFFYNNKFYSIWQNNKPFGSFSDIEEVEFLYDPEWKYKQSAKIYGRASRATTLKFVEWLERNSRYDYNENYEDKIYFTKFGLNLIESKITFNFSCGLKLLEEGKRIRVTVWDNYLYLKKTTDGELSVIKICNADTKKEVTFIPQPYELLEKNYWELYN